MPVAGGRARSVRPTTATAPRQSDNPGYRDA
ncbi:hypothetical protein Rrhod_0358 [Rhodococcus rhodnii LMG 5362]|uniref:Uncharacterized protein n=1 Tax=Rhodococcus rhodnii LMG 5362 TaxID=1273125 RepID=R7WSI5_9NOCA|nr:hypothetical protein Rrhod_0358 [Rhodococcus rhodnii LMG 5362]